MFLSLSFFRICTVLQRSAKFLQIGTVLQRSAKFLQICTYLQRSVEILQICTYLQRSAKILQIFTDLQRSKTWDDCPLSIEVVSLFQWKEVGTNLENVFHSLHKSCHFIVAVITSCSVSLLNSN